MTEASRQGSVRPGAYGSAWFAHRSQRQVAHVEVRSLSYKGSLRDGRKTLFQFSDQFRDFVRLEVLEVPIDTLSLAAIEEVRRDILYVATGSGMGPGTLEALQANLARLHASGSVMVSGADANAAGDRYAARHAELAAAAPC